MDDCRLGVRIARKVWATDHRAYAGALSVALLCLGSLEVSNRVQAQGAPARQADSPAHRVSLQPCKVPNITEEVRCGTYEVYENRAKRSGRKIALNIVVVPALNSAPAPDPLFWIDGGPGVGSTGSAGLARIWFAEVRKTRDLIFVDQRGTGKSNPLNCDYGSSPDDLQGFFGPAPVVERVRRCRQALEKSADLRLYTTPLAMDDLDEVRAALGYDKINVAGISYGSLASQIYLRQHGDHVRTVSLLALITPDFKLPLGFPRSVGHAFDLLFDACAADATCNGAFPNLRDEFKAVLARFNNGLVEVELLRLSDKQKQTVSLSKDNFIQRLTYVLANTDTSRLLPFIIHRAFQNDYVPFETAAVLLNPTAGIARGMYFSVTCSETARFITEAEVIRETAGTPGGDHPVREHMEACKEWPLGEVPRSYVNPVRSNVPVLIIAGEADPLSGPWFADNAIKFLPKGRLVSIREFGHQFGDPCTRGIFSAFIERGSGEGLDTACIDSIHRPTFATELPRRFALPGGS